MDRGLRTAYAILGIQPSAPIDAVRRRYKALAKKWHPDRFVGDPQGVDEATMHMRAINSAYEAILRARSVEPGKHGTDGWTDIPTNERSGISLTKEQIAEIVTAINRRESIWDRIKCDPWNRLLSLLVILGHAIMIVYNEWNEIPNFATSGFGIIMSPLFLHFIWSERTALKLFGWFWLLIFSLVLPVFGAFTGYYE